MRQTIKRLVLRLFPELVSGLHLDRYARVLQVTDAADLDAKGNTCERFRPRYAVDLEILTPEGERDEAFPIYEAVPLPVPVGAGHEAGMVGYPQAGTLVIIGFAYGRPDHPVIRQVYPLGLSLPDLQVGAQKWQYNSEVLQQVDAAGNWQRKTTATITDESFRHVTRTTEKIDELLRELRTVAEHSTEEVGGIKTIEALGALRLLSGGSVNLSGVDSVNLTTGRDITTTAAQDRLEAIGRNHTEQIVGSSTRTVGKDDTITVAGNEIATIAGNSTEQITGDKIMNAKNLVWEFSGTMRFGSGTVSLLHLMMDVWAEVRDALHELADHTHAGGVKPDQTGIVHAHADAVNDRRAKLEGITG